MSLVSVRSATNWPRGKEIKRIDDRQKKAFLVPNNDKTIFSTNRKNARNFSILWHSVISILLTIGSLKLKLKIENCAYVNFHNNRLHRAYFGIYFERELNINSSYLQAKIPELTFVFSYIYR